MNLGHARGQEWARAGEVYQRKHPPEGRGVFWGGCGRFKASIRAGRG